MEMKGLFMKDKDIIATPSVGTLCGDCYSRISLGFDE